MVNPDRIGKPSLILNPAASGKHFKTVSFDKIMKYYYVYANLMPEKPFINIFYIAYDINMLSVLILKRKKDIAHVYVHVHIFMCKSRIDDA